MYRHDHSSLAAKQKLLSILEVLHYFSHDTGVNSCETGRYVVRASCKFSRKEYNSTNYDFSYEAKLLGYELICQVCLHG